MTSQERVISHIATGTAPQPQGRTGPNSSGVSAMVMTLVVESMEMAPGTIPRSGRVREQRLLSLESCLGDGGRDGTFRGCMATPLGFSRDGEYIGERAESDAARGAQTHP